MATDITRDDIRYRRYRSEQLDLQAIMDLVDQELSEPPHLSFLAYPPASSSTTPDNPIATVICKQERHRGKKMRGYIAMLSVEKGWRRKGIARKLVQIAIEEMMKHGAEEIVLETEFDNAASLALYRSFGFIREKRLYRFYLNGKDAFRLILPVVPSLQASSGLTVLMEDEETEEEADEARDAIGTGPPDLHRGHAERNEMELDAGPRPGEGYAIDYGGAQTVGRVEEQGLERVRLDLQDVKL